jgi:ribonuclease D
LIIKTASTHIICLNDENKVLSASSSICVLGDKHSMPSLKNELIDSAIFKIFHNQSNDFYMLNITINKDFFKKK